MGKTTLRGIYPILATAFTADGAIDKSSQARLVDFCIDGVFGGNSGVFLPEEIAAGCCGTMPACYMPDVFRHTWDLIEAGDNDAASAYFSPYSRIAAYEKDLANRCVWKTLLVERGVIESDAVREPSPAFAGELVNGQLLAIARAAGLFSAATS